MRLPCPSTLLRFLAINDRRHIWKKDWWVNVFSIKLIIADVSTALILTPSRWKYHSSRDYLFMKECRRVLCTEVVVIKGHPGGEVSMLSIKSLDFAWRRPSLVQAGKYAATKRNCWFERKKKKIWRDDFKNSSAFRSPLKSSEKKSLSAIMS